MFTRNSHPLFFPKKPGNKSHTREDHPRTCKWSANPRYKPWKGHDLLTMVFNHLQVTSHGMILQVFTANSPEFARRHWWTFASDTSIFASLGIVPTVSTLHQLPAFGQFRESIRFSGFRLKILRAAFDSIWMFPKIVGFPPNSSHFNWVFHYKPSILGETPLFFFGNTHIHGDFQPTLQ